MDPDTQLELFDVPRRDRPEAHAPIGTLQIRQDHAVLLTIAALIGVSVVFAGGVERGKQLVRAERPLLSPETTISRATPQATGAPAMVITRTAPSVPAERPDASAPSKRSETQDTQETQAPQRESQKPANPREIPKAPTKTATTRSRFAIQVVTYTKPQLAQQELSRLKGRGEQAFIVMKDGRVMLYVGPFPSKEHAAAKLATLKQQYQDCFLRIL